MKAKDGSCVDCVEIFAKCKFGKGSQPEPGTPDTAFDAAEELAKAQLLNNKDAPAVPYGDNTDTVDDDDDDAADTSSAKKKE